MFAAMMYCWVYLPVILSTCMVPCLGVYVHDFGGEQLEDNNAKVLILGGGPAGIHAAATLMENGISDFIILEGSNRLRGYLKPVEFGGHTFSPGGLWAFSSESVLIDKLSERNISYYESDYDNYIIRNSNGGDVTDQADANYERLAKAILTLDEVGAAVDKNERSDIAQQAALARGGWISKSDIDKVIEWFDFDFSEGLLTRDTSTIGPYRQQDFIEYFILDDVTLGGPLLEDAESMLKAGHVRTDQFAVYVDHAAGDSVTVLAVNGSTITQYTGEYVIVANTIGVLQHGAVEFNPPLPEWKIEEIFRYQMATMDTLFLKFDSKFWDDEAFIMRASDRHGYFPLFMNLEAEGMHPAGTNILVAILVGNEAYQAELRSDDELKAEVINILRNMYGESNVPDPTEFYMSRFATDPNLYGSYPSWPIGSIPEDAADRLRANVGRVFFALEGATDTENIGFSISSVTDGKAAATSIVACIADGGNCAEYEPVDSSLCKENVSPVKQRKDFNYIPPS